MDPSNFFAPEIFTELGKALYQVSRKSIMCKETAEQVLEDIRALSPIIREIQYYGVKLPQHRQQQISQLMETMNEGIELSDKVASSGRWNVYKNLQKARKFEKIQKRISKFVQTLMLAQCVNLSCLPEGIGRLSSLEKIDMRECSQIRGLPASASTMRSLRRVICDEEVSWLWKDIKKALPSLNVQVVEKCFPLDWLDD